MNRWITRGMAAASALALARAALAASVSLVDPTNNKSVAVTQASVPINISTATTTLLVAAAAGKGIYVTEWNVLAGGTGNLTFEYGTGATCTTPTVITGAYPLTAQTRMDAGTGIGSVLVIPASAAGNALCAVTSAAVQMSGSLAYAQF